MVCQTVSLIPDAARLAGIPDAMPDRASASPAPSDLCFARPTVRYTASANEIKKEIMTILITARKRSLRQGNVFTPVCHSVLGPGEVVCLWVGGGGAHLRQRWPLKRAVCILLECILVDLSICAYTDCSAPRGKYGRSADTLAPPPPTKPRNTK